MSYIFKPKPALILFGPSLKPNPQSGQPEPISSLNQGGQNRYVALYQSQADIPCFHILLIEEEMQEDWGPEQVGLGYRAISAVEVIEDVLV